MSKARSTKSGPLNALWTLDGSHFRTAKVDSTSAENTLAAAQDWITLKQQ
jgi:hypothetical protein